MRKPIRVLYIIVALCLGLAASTAVLADATTTKLFYTRHSGSPNVKSVDLTYDGVTMTLGPPVVIGTTFGADGITGNPQNSDLLIVGGQGGRMNTISISTGTATVFPSPVSVFHLEVADATTIYGSGIPGALAKHTINPGGTLSAGTTITVSGPDTTITQLITTPAGFFYTSSGPGGAGSFGTLAFTGATTATTTRLASPVLAAHGGVYDPLTGTIILMGDDHLTQFDLAGTLIADLDFAAMGMGFITFDQGTVDGSGHLFVASNSGHLVFLDYAAAAGGLIDDPGNFLDVQFLDSNLDDIAPLVGPGGTDPCDPDPRTQGYWHRQCKGLGLITSGRSDRGPTHNQEPDFDKLLPDVSDELFNRVGEARACVDGMQAIPSSDQCEKAIKQFTAVLFNRESGRLQDTCEVDVSAEGCSSTTLGDLVQEITDLINSGTEGCRIAKDCAGSVNEGTAVVESSGLAIASTSAVDTIQAQPTTLSHGGAGDQHEAPTATLEAPQAELGSDILLGLGFVPANSTPVEDAPVTPEEPVKTLARHLAVMGSEAATPEEVEESTDALLTFLSGGYEPGTRLHIIETLLGRIDVAFHGLLVEHLQDIRAEAMDFEDADLVRESDRLLKQLESDEE